MSKLSILEDKLNEMKLDAQREFIQETIVKPVVDGLCSDKSFNLVRLAVQEAIGVGSKSINIIRPYKDFFELKEVCEDDYIMWNDLQYKEILDDLKFSAVNLVGQSGVGKDFIAEHIGYDLTGYKGFYYGKICCGVNPPYRLSYGTGTDGSEYLGIILEGAIKALESKDYAVVVHISEITRCDFTKFISNIFDFLSEKGRSYIKLPEFGNIVYPDNLFIVCTSNVGSNFKAGSFSDSALNSRFHIHKIIGILENDDTINAFLSKFEDQSKVVCDFLLDLYTRIDENDKDINRSIDTRRILQCIKLNRVSAELLDLNAYLRKKCQE